MIQNISEGKSEVSYKEKAAFAEPNKDRVRRIIEAKGDSIQLSKIAPAFIVTDLTWRCNYNCRGCIDQKAVKRGFRNKSLDFIEGMDLPMEIIRYLWDYIARRGVRGMMTMGGEVFLYRKGIMLALQKSIEHRIPLKTVSNGSCLGNYIELITQAYTIPESMIRVSINADKEHYQEQTGQKHTTLEEVLGHIQAITSKGVHVSVSTVVFPESSPRPNINQIEKIVAYCMNVGVHLQIFLAARNPKKMKRYTFTEKEREKLMDISRRYSFPHLEMGDLLQSDDLIFQQDLSYCPCPSGFLFTLIGSDGKVYQCTDHRGNKDAVLTQIKAPGDFEKYWHSPERVEAQKKFGPGEQCKEMTCIRYVVNKRLSCACRAYDPNKPEMIGGLVESLIVNGSKHVYY